MNADDMAYGAPDAPTSEELAELDNVDNTDDSPLGVLRRKLRALHHRGSQDTARHMQLAVADILQADEWERAAEEAATLRTQLAHWRTFAIHAESEHAAWKKTATELDDELRQLRIAVARAVADAEVGKPHTTAVGDEPARRAHPLGPDAGLGGGEHEAA